MILKPMDIGEILDTTFRVYKNNFKTYITLSAINLAPPLVLALLGIIAYLIMGETEAFFIALGVMILIGIIPVILVSLAVIRATIKVVSEQILDRQMEYKEAFKFGYQRKWPIFAAAVLMVLAVFIGSIFLIIPGILFYIWFSLYAQAAVIEDLGAMKSLSRSKALIKGAWWRSFGVILVMTIIVGFLSNIVTLPAQFILPLIISEGVAVVINYILSLGMSLLLTPLSHIALTLLYYDLRVRKEGYDIQVMTESFQQVPENTLQE